MEQENGKKSTKLQSGRARWEAKVAGAEAVGEQAEKKGGSGSLVVAVLLYAVAAVFCVYAAMSFSGKMDFGILPPVWQGVIFVVLDLLAIVVASYFWRTGNERDPVAAGEKGFWFRNHFGQVLASFAFVPFVFLVLFSKTAGAKAKIFSCLAALLMAGLVVVLILFVK